MPEQPLTAERDIFRLSRVEPQTIEHPWGHELRWAAAQAYSGSILFLRQGARLTLDDGPDTTIYVNAGSLSVDASDAGPRASASATIEAGAALRREAGQTIRLRALTDATLLQVAATA